MLPKLKKGMKQNLFIKEVIRSNNLTFFRIYEKDNRQEFEEGIRNKLDRGFFIISSGQYFINDQNITICWAHIGENV